MDRCPAGHERTRKPDGSLGLFCTDCGYRFPSTDELESLSMDSFSCAIDKLIQEGTQGISIDSTGDFYLSGDSSNDENVPSSSEVESNGQSSSESSADALPELIKKEKDGVEKPEHSQLSHVTRPEPPAPLNDSDAHKGAIPKRRANLGAPAMAKPRQDDPKPLQPSLLFEIKINDNSSFTDNSKASSKNDSTSADIESGQEKLDNGSQSESCHKNVAVKTIPHHSQQHASSSRADSASPVLSFGSRNSITGCLFESAGVSVGDENNINNSSFDSGQDVRLGSNNLIRDSTLKSETSIVMGNDNKMKDSKFIRKQNSTNRQP